MQNHFATTDPAVERWSETIMRPRVLVALSERERKLFFPGDIVLAENASIAWVSEEEVASATWKKNYFSSWRPEILVTAWGTPPLPLAWIERSDFSVRYICHVTGSVRRVVPREYLERGGVLTNWGGIAAPYVAEHALLLALATLRNLPAWRPAIESREKNGSPSVEYVAAKSIFGKRIGIHGFGRIARALVELLRPFQTSICAFSQGVPREAMETLGVRPCSSLRELFSVSDVLFECEALTPKSSGSVTAAILAALPDDALFVNVGRGDVVDESALLNEVQRGRIRVALDVVKNEPLRTSSGFFRMEDVLLSPHIGGPTFESYGSCGQLALRNIDAFLKGEPLEGLLTLEDYDRST